MYILLIFSIILLSISVRYYYKIEKLKNKEVNEYYTEKIEEQKRKIKQLEAEFDDEQEKFDDAIYQKSLRLDEINRRYEEAVRRHNVTAQDLKQAVEAEVDAAREVAYQQLDQDIALAKIECERKKTAISKEVEEIQTVLDDFKKKQESVHLAILKEKEIKEQEAFYRIIISDDDKQDIAILKDVAYKMCNREVVNKFIYTTFIKRPLDEMIKRITSGRHVSGIYKITYCETGESYIGKTTDISNRWTDHLKTACGLDGAARTTLHNKMNECGVDKFTFQILEEVPKEKLSEREKFYINLYGTDKQLNMKKGG